MRELGFGELNLASGGTTPDDPLVLPTVTVTGTRPGSSYYPGMMSAYDSMGIESYLHRLQGTYDGLGPGGGGGVYDPSPEDGIYGIQAAENADGTIDWTVETYGYFDLDGSGAQESYEPTYSPGQNGTTDTAHDGGSFSTEYGWETLGTFKPTTGPGFV